MGPSTTYAARVWRVLCVAPLGALAVGCADTPAPPQLEDGQATALIEALEADDYPSWDPPPTSNALPRRRRASGAHGPWVEVYLHPALLDAFFGDTALEVWPEGVAAVVESYEDESAEVPYLRSAMRRDEGGWSWGQVDAEGAPLSDARPDDCIGCHGAGEDFVFSVFLPDGE